MSLENEMAKLTKAIEALTVKIGEVNAAEAVQETLDKTESAPELNEVPVSKTVEEPKEITREDITNAAREAVKRDTSNREKAKQLLAKHGDGATKVADLKDEHLSVVLQEIKKL